MFISVLRKYKVEIGVFIMVVAVQLLYVALTNAPLNWFDSAIYDATAWNFVQGDGFTYTPGIPDALREPGYAFFVLVPVYAIFGHSIFAAQVAQALLSAFTAVLLIVIGKRFISKNAGIAAALIFALHPAIIVNVGEIMTEAWFMLLLTAFTYVLLVGVEKKMTRWFVLGGVLLGLAALTRMAALPLIGIVPVVLLLITRNVRFSIRYGIVIGVISLAVYTPWVVRNYTMFDRVLLGRTGGGEIIWTGSYVPWDGDWQGYIWPLTEYRTGADFFEHDAQMIDRAIENIKQDPLTVAWLYLKKPLKIFIQPEGLHFTLERGAFNNNTFMTLMAIILYVYHCVLLVLAGIGMLRFSKYRNYAIITVCILIYFVIVYLPLNAVPRYAVPLYPLILLLSGLGVIDTFSFVTNYRKHT